MFICVRAVVISGVRVCGKHIGAVALPVLNDVGRTPEGITLVDDEESCGLIETDATGRPTDRLKELVIAVVDGVVPEVVAGPEVVMIAA